MTLSNCSEKLLIKVGHLMVRSHMWGCASRLVNDRTTFAEALGSGHQCPIMPWVQCAKPDPSFAVDPSKQSHGLSNGLSVLRVVAG